MDKKLSLCILIGRLRRRFGLPLGSYGSHLITHYDNIITDVQSHKGNSCRTERNVSNWSFSLCRPLFTSMLLFYRLPLQSGLGPIWPGVSLAIWAHCWWSVAVPLEEPVGGERQRQRRELHDFYKALAKLSKCLPLFKQGRRHRLAFCLCTGTPPPSSSQVGPQVGFHILQTAPQRGDVYYDAKLPRWDATTTLCVPAPLTVCRGGCISTAIQLGGGSCLILF